MSGIIEKILQMSSKSPITFCFSSHSVVIIHTDFPINENHFSLFLLTVFEQKLIGHSKVRNQSNFSFRILLFQLPLKQDTTTLAYTILPTTTTTMILRPSRQKRLTKKKALSLQSSEQAATSPTQPPQQPVPPLPRYSTTSP